MKSLATLLLAALLAGCAAAPPAPDPAPLFSDAAFGPPGEHIGADDLFALTPAMRTYLNSDAFRAQLRLKGSEQGLIDALYRKGELQLEYDSAVTRNAGQTYEARSGNCMSLVIMTAAFAKALGLHTRYQSVAVDRTWRRIGGLYMASGHVNLSLSAIRPMYGNQRDDEAARSLTVDFLASQDMAGYRTNPVEEKTIVAMYMNNRAVEALALDKLDDAYWWARAAVERDPGFTAAYNTLGVAYQRHGDWQLAERTFRTALANAPQDIVVMQNLAPLLAALGKGEESQALAAQLARLDPERPFQDFDLGMKALDRHDYQAAKTLFARAAGHAPYNDEFHFWLGVAHLRLGEASQAREQIAMALDRSTTGDGKARYSAKLAHLRAQAAQAAQSAPR